jgi:hypothetical protein
MTESEHKICPVCARDACIETCPGDTCSPECARTFVIVEVGHELLKLLRVLAHPVYYSTPEGGVTPIPPSHLEAMKHGMGGGATWDEDQGRYVPVMDDRGLPTGQVGPRHSWPAAEPAPHPTDEEQ